MAIVVTCPFVHRHLKTTRCFRCLTNVRSRGHTETVPPCGKPHPILPKPPGRPAIFRVGLPLERFCNWLVIAKSKYLALQSFCGKSESSWQRYCPGQNTITRICSRLTAFARSEFRPERKNPFVPKNLILSPSATRTLEAVTQPRLDRMKLMKSCTSCKSCLKAVSGQERCCLKWYWVFPQGGKAAS